MRPEYQIIINTCPNQEHALKMANALVDSNLAACVSIIPGLTSIYKWQGQRETGSEVLLMIKTRSEFYEQIEAKIKSMHPYELPEIISVPIKSGLTAYLDWIDNSTGI